MISFGACSLLVFATAFSLSIPATADQKIVTRHTLNGGHDMITTIYVRGQRQRLETVWERQAGVGDNRVMIQQFDLRRVLVVSPADKTYRYTPMDIVPRPRSLLPEPAAKGGDVNITIDSVDTGERRQVADFTARHVRSITRVEAGPGACQPSSVTEVDGRYIDLPTPHAGNKRAAGFSYLAPGCRDRFHFQRLGSAPQGYPIEQTSRSTQQGRTFVSRIELLEASSAPLDPALFEVPSGYKPALHTAWGDDFRRTDSFSNRVQAYWERVVYSVRRCF